MPLKPRYIVAAFQTVDKGVVNIHAEWQDPQNINASIFESSFVGQAGSSRNNTMTDVNYVDVHIIGDNYQLMDYNNNFDQNSLARWYNENTNLEMSYSNSFNDYDMVSYDSFRNVHRMYVLDIPQQSGAMNNGIANVRLELCFSAPIQAVADAQVNLYCVSFYDRVWKLKSDGTIQCISEEVS
jgi:hypothetical protein